jgi:predicted hotdog family 3-hydroxylacyl-ACP dehydratase
MSAPDQLPAALELLPHRGCMLLIERFLQFGPAGTVALAVPDALAWYADVQGNMPAWIGIELMAQTVAGHAALCKRARGLPASPGVLLGTRRYQAAVPWYAAGVPLEVAVSGEFGDAGGLAVFECSIRSPQLEVASATLKVYEPENFKRFLEENRA